MFSWFTMVYLLKDDGVSLCHVCLSCGILQVQRKVDMQDDVSIASGGRSRPKDS